MPTLQTSQYGPTLKSSCSGEMYLHRPSVPPFTSLRTRALACVPVCLPACVCMWGGGCLVVYGDMLLHHNTLQQWDLSKGRCAQKDMWYMWYRIWYMWYRISAKCTGSTTVYQSVGPWEKGEDLARRMRTKQDSLATICIETWTTLEHSITCRGPSGHVRHSFSRLFDLTFEQ